MKSIFVIVGGFYMLHMVQPLDHFGWNNNQEATSLEILAQKNSATSCLILRGQQDQEISSSSTIPSEIAGKDITIATRNVRGYGIPGRDRRGRSH